MINSRLSFVASICLLVLAHCFIGSVEVGAATETAMATAEPKEKGGSEEIDEAQSVPQHFDLGVFEIRQWRSTRNETIDMQFELYLVLAKGTDDAVKSKLEFWRHRLREQILTAVRLTETKFFSEPDLIRLRRVILLRINRILPEAHFNGVYITRYVFGTK